MVKLLTFAFSFTSSFPSLFSLIPFSLLVSILLLKKDDREQGTENPPKHQTSSYCPGVNTFFFFLKKTG